MKALDAIDWSVVRLLSKRRLYRKLLNYIVVQIQYARRDPFLLGNPYFIYIDPSSRCTLGCPFCAVGARTYRKPMKDMPFDVFKRVMDELGPHLIAIDLFVKGEPLMNKRIYDMIAYCKKYRMLTRISSNMQDMDEEAAVKMVESGLDSIMASIDGVSQESYEQYRIRGDVQLAFRNIRYIVAAKKKLKRETPVILWKYIVFRHNEHELEAARKMAAELGVDDISFVVPSVGAPPLSPEQEKWLPLNKQYRAYDDAGTEFTRGMSTPELLPACNLPWASMTVDPLGNIQTCCRPVDFQHDHGAAKRGFSWSVWNNRRYRQSRQYVRDDYTGSDATNFCAGCTVGSSLSIAVPDQGMLQRI